MAMAVWDPLRTTHGCSFSAPSSSRKTRETSTSSIARSIGNRVCTSSAVPGAYYPNGGNSASAMGGGGSMCRRRRRISVSLAIFETMHVEPRVHCTARGASDGGTLRIARVHRPDSLNLHSNGDGEGRRLKKGSGASISRAAGRLSNHRGKNHVTLTRVASSASDSPPPATSAEASSASDNLDTDVASSLSSPTPPVSSAISEEGVDLGLGLEGGLLSAEEGVLSREAEREAEKFAVVYTGDYQCRSCGYEYIEVMGDESYPIPPGMPFASLPSDWACPICGAPRTYFNPKRVEVAGFVQNQKYGLGGNSLTSGQKSLLIYGSLLFFFGVFISGYFLQ
eukprot:TRINITY_DN336_c0_g2_i1.p1 TRINITY_DN336_c0_g2~~TRINITY_DN336_c0_g2_i1.p1  ORF type:complete len:338 (+),score=46.18 TRINITY_DN336_c0_g2_i1:138-1151(+)